MRGTERLDRCSPSAGTGAIPGTRGQPVQLSIKEIKSGIKKYITYHINLNIEKLLYGFKNNIALLG